MYIYIHTYLHTYIWYYKTYIHVCVCTHILIVTIVVTVVLVTGHCGIAVIISVLGVVNYTEVSPETLPPPQYPDICATAWMTANVQRILVFSFSRLASPLTLSFVFMYSFLYLWRRAHFGCSSVRDIFWLSLLFVSGCLSVSLSAVSDLYTLSNTD